MSEPTSTEALPAGAPPDEAAPLATGRSGDVTQETSGGVPPWLRTAVAKYALVMGWALMALYFYVQVPDLFGTTGTLRSIVGSQQAIVLVFLGMGALITLVVGEFDLSIASVMAISATRSRFSRGCTTSPSASLWTDT